MASSAIPKINAATFPWINVVDYGAVADDSMDNTAAFNNALAAAGPGQITFVPPGTYRVNGDITVPAFQFLQGAGNFGTQLHVTTNTQTNGLVNLSQGSALKNIAIAYDQPDVAVYGTFIQYKPAVLIDSQPWGVTVESVRISKAWDGIKFGGVSGNGGRSYFRNIEMSMFNRGMDFDGAQDTVRIQNYHVWPFNLTANQQTAFQLSGHSVALYIGRVDGFQVHGLMAINGTGLDAHIGAGGFAANIYFNNCIFDTYASVLWNANIGTGYFNNCFFSSGAAEARNVFRVTDGRILVSNSQFYGLTTGGMMQVNGGNVQVSNCRFTSVTGDQSSIVQTAGYLEVNGCYFDRGSGGIPYAKPFVDVSGGGLCVISSNTCTNIGAGAGTFVKAPADISSVVSGNCHVGWAMNLPANPVHMRVYGNE